MPVAKRITTAFGARAERVRAVLFALAVFLCIASVSVEVAAQSAPPPTLTPWGGLDTLYARMVYARNQEIAARSASAAGVEVAASGSVSVMNGATMAGKVAINEIRVVPLARIAARVATSTAPIALAMIAADLISYGIKQCTESASGWCKPGQTNPNSGDTGFTGFMWSNGGGVGAGITPAQDSPVAYCRAAVSAHNGAYGTGYKYVGVQQKNSTTYNCVIDAGSSVGEFAIAVQTMTCVSGYVYNNGKCSPDPNTNVPPRPVTYPELSDKLAQALTGNPNRAKDYWGITPLDGWKDWLNESTTQAKPAEVTSPADGRVPGPRRSTTTSAGTTTTDTTYTVRPNTDAGTMKDAPVTVTTTVTTTHPDGTTETTTTSEQPVPDRGGGGAKVEVKSCGLADTAPCKIDETGTPTAADGKSAVATAQSDLAQIRQDAETNFTKVNAGRTFDLHMPHLLPGGTCQPVEWFSWGSWRGSWDPCDSMAYVRTLLSWLWYTLAAIYIWNRTASANAGAQ